MNHEAVYRTAPATPGLLKIYIYINAVGSGMKGLAGIKGITLYYAVF